jgi:hypothetical protein
VDEVSRYETAARLRGKPSGAKARFFMALDFAVKTATYKDTERR